MYRVVEENKICPFIVASRANEDIVVLREFCLKKLTNLSQLLSGSFD